MKQNKLVTAVSKIIGISLGVSVLGIQVAQAGKSVTVDSISDQAEQGLITLREAIEITNQFSGTEINFDPAVFSEPQTITLENGELLIASAVTINGPGADMLTINGNDESRIFTVDDGTSATQVVSMSGLTLTGGNGASTVNDGVGGCVMSFEQLSILDSKVTGCDSRAGGGVWSRYGTLLIENSEITNNLAGNRGGGVYARGALASIANSTISGNTANRLSEAGGGVNARSADLEIINSTISNNQVRNANAGGIYMKGSEVLTLMNSTVFNNAGMGIDPSGLVNISNSLIAGHSAGDCDFTQIGINSNNQNNMDSDGSCDVQASNHSTVSDPMLEPLANFGGGTLTHRPLPGSPVIDSGDDSLCTEFDQRGETRPQDGDADGTSICDIGAVELTLFEDVIFINSFEN
ncbi:hypothetical protein MNBD_GAMMA02-1816 [hydrothermal vent metagenome]|uniref:Right handed beta helix domain-containing protein n=1 Tax=hydrothermal vent metagenome TaxID=652676 RepID=A0A3B0VQL5_9ZZZZ